MMTIVNSVTTETTTNQRCHHAAGAAMRTSSLTTLVVITAAWILASMVPLRAKAQVADPIERRLADVKALLNGTLDDPTSVFAPSFLAAVPAAQLKAGVSSLTSTTGSCTSISVTKRNSATSVVASALMTNNYSVPVVLTIEESAPHLIAGLFLKPPVKLASDLTTIIGDLGALPGTTSICVVDVSNNTVLASKDTLRALPMGSTFKLYILGELARSVSQGTLRWEQVIKLNRAFFSLPSGILQTWPHSAPLTVYAMAALMISQSDNTATDHLLYFAGRDSVAQILPTMGNTHASANIPFLSTQEIFKLKFYNDGVHARIYANAEPESRQEQLQALSEMPLDSVVLTDKPVFPDQVEWFASTPDLCRAISILEHVAETQHEVRDILGINRGLDLSKETWPVVGYKGGSEPGVMNMTYFLERKDGRRFALSASWLRSDQDVDKEKLAAIVGGAIRVLADVK